MLIKYRYTSALSVDNIEEIDYIEETGASRPFCSGSIGLWNGRPEFDSRTAHVTFVETDHEIISSVIRTVYVLLWHAKVKATSTGKLFDCLPRNDAVVELCSYCREPGGKLPTPPPPPPKDSSNNEQTCTFIFLEYPETFTTYNASWILK
jgi:hypothetical protein